MSNSSGELPNGMQHQQQQLLGQSNIFEFMGLESMDPSVTDDYHIVYEREVPIEIRHQHDGNGRNSHIAVDCVTSNVTGGTFESIRVKMLLSGSDDAPSAVRLELSSESDLFFHYMHVATGDEFHVIHEKQRLLVDFADYPKILIRMMNELIREPRLHVGVLTLIADQEARLDFIQNMEYKFVELMSCSFSRSPMELVEEQITFRYNVLKQRLNIMTQRLAEINTLVKAKNPSLLMHLQQTGGSTINPPGIGSASAPSSTGKR